MKDLKEFKYQHQLDEGSQYKAPRSRFDLYCGMLLGALAVGILWPAATKWVAKESRIAHAMPAKKLLALNSLPNEIKISKPLSSDKIILKADEDTGATSTEKVSIPVEAKPIKSVAVKSEKLKEKKIVASKKTFVAKPLEKKELRVASRSSPSAKLLRNETMMESETLFTAADVQAKTDATLLKNDLSSDASDTSATDAAGPFVTLSSVQYDKTSLANCKSRCLLKAKDAKGGVVNAIISGPSFADILMEHQGTINLTGKKSTIKKHEVFLVQNITFNLPDTNSGVANSGKQNSPKSNVSQPNTAPGIYKGGTEAYEDLGSDLAPR